MEVKDENTPVLQAKVLNGDGDLRRTTPGQPLKPVNDERRLSSQRMKTTSPTKVTPSNSPYTYIRQLDSAERWIERTSVLTKQDHALNLHHASSILEEIVNSLPISNVSNSWINEEPVGKDDTIPQHNQDSQISVSNSFVEIDELANLLSDLALSASFSTNPHAENPVPKKPGSKSVSTLKDSALMKKVDAIDDESKENLSLRNPAVDRHSKSHLSCASLTAKNIDSDLKVAKDVEREQLEKQPESKDQVIVKQGNPSDPLHSCSQIPRQSRHDNQATGLVSSVSDAIDLQNESGEQYDKAGSFKPEEKLDDVEELHQQKSKLLNSSAAGKLDTSTDELNLNAEPFKPKAQLVNSPIAGKLDGAVCEKDLTVNPFETKTQVVNSPITRKLDAAMCDNDLTLNPFVTKTQVVNSPIAGKLDGAVCEKDLTVNPFETKTQVVNSPIAGKLDGALCEKDLTVNPFETKTQVVNSPIAGKLNGALCEKDLTVNPFETKTQVVNSPIAGKLDGAVCEKDLTVNPFETKTQVVNSPIAGKLDGASCEKDLTVNPFETKTQVVNSPITRKLDGAMCDNDLTVSPFVTKTQVVNSPIAGKLDGAVCEKDFTVNPLETKIPLANSPVTKKLDCITVEEDPFQPKAQLCNSPSSRELNSADGIQGLKADSLQPLVQQNEKLINAPTLEQLINAPASEPLVGDEKELNQSGKANEANLVILHVTKQLEVSISEKDLKMTPLKTQTQHIDSTAVLQVEKTSDELDLTEDPFIPKAQLFNSPSSIGKLESAESKQDVSAPEAQYNTPVNNPDLNVKSIRSKGQHLNSSPTENTEVSIDDLNVDQLKTEAQLSSAGGKFDTECKEVRITLCSSSSQLLSSSGSEQKSHLNENSDRVQNTLEGSLVDEIQKFSIQDTNTPVKNITQIHDPLENQAVESQLITEMSSSASNKLEVNHVMYPCATQKIQEETVTSSTPTSNCQARDEQIIAKGLMKSKDPSSLSSQKVKNCGAIQPDIGKMLEDKNEIVIEDPNMSKNSGDQISTKASILAPTLQTKSPQITSDTNISINPLNLKTQLINTPSANNLTSCNSNNSKSSYDQENYFSIESSNASSFNLTIQEIAMSPEDKDTEQKVSNVEPLKDESDKAHAQEDMVTAVTDKPFIVNHDKESFPKHSAAHESIPNTPKIKTSRNDDVTKAKDESIPFSPQEPDIAENELFIPATEAFNDPAFFDMLEHTSSGKAPNSKRGSVLLKFDPLQDRRDSLASKSLNTSPDTIIQGQAQKPGRMSDVFKDSKLGISFIDESVCLFGTPPRVARRRTLTRRVHNYRAQSIEEENSSNEVDMIFGLDNEGDGMDTIINDNLHPMNEGPRLVDIGEMPVYTESDLKQIRADLTMHFQELMLKKDREFQEKLKEQGQLAELEKEKFKTETNGLNQKIKSLHGKLKSLNDVMKGYTEIISQLTVEKEKAQLEVEKVTVDLSELQKYNSQVIEDNKTLEKSFDDLFHRYEKLKQTLEKAAENEKVLKQAVQSAQEKYKSIKETARKIKEVAEAKIAEQDEKYEKLSSSTKSELTRLEASLKMKDMQVQGLENTLEQKRKENKELTDLCDSLINKVSSK